MNNLYGDIFIEFERINKISFSILLSIILKLERNMMKKKISL